MSWDFDCTEGLIGLSRKALEVAKPEDFFEGFYVDGYTYNDWLNPLDFGQRKLPK